MDSRWIPRRAEAWSTEAYVWADYFRVNRHDDIDSEVRMEAEAAVRSLPQAY